MRKSNHIIKFSTTILLLFFCSYQLSAQGKADIIIHNAKVHSMDKGNPTAEAIAIKGNKVMAVGSNAEINKLKGKASKSIDAKGKTVIPGLFDSHAHVIRAGRFYNSELRWDGVHSLERALQMLKEQAERTPKGQWVRVVGGWSPYQFKEERFPTLEEINTATGDVPTFVLYLYGKVYLNKAAVAALKLNSESENPPGGLIEKDKHGNPTGMLFAEPNAFILYSTLSKLPELSDEEKINSTLLYMTELNRLGITSVMDAGGGFQNYPDDYSITDKLNEEGKISIRLPHYLFAQKKGEELNDYTKWVGMVDVGIHPKATAVPKDYYVAGAGENIVSDAGDFENFLFPRPELPESMETQLLPVIRLLVNNKWPFRLHATYDETIGRMLDVIEAVNEEIPLGDLVWFFDHAETVSDANLKRIKALGGGIAIQNRMSFQGENFIRRYGKKAANQAPPIHKILEMGIPVGLGTDATRVSSFNPWKAIHWLVSGKTVGNTEILQKENRLDRTLALELMTKGGYDLIRQSNEKGLLKPGYFADLIILDQDYFSIPEDDIKKLKSNLTIVDGKIVYADEQFKAFSKEKLEVIPAWSPVKYYGGYQDN